MQLPRRPMRAPVARRLPLLALLLTSCSLFAPTVTVSEPGPDAVFEQLNAYVVSHGELSMGSRDVLHAFGLTEVVDDDPRKALDQLHTMTVAEPTRMALFALAELSYLIGDDDDDRDAYLASAIYAYHYLFGTEASNPPSPYDRRFRWACDMYNGALMRAMMAPDGHHIALTGGRRWLPRGTIDLSVDRSDFPWTAEQYPELLPADRFRIKGLTLRLRDAGLGVPLIAVPEPSLAMMAAKGTTESRTALARTPATLFLRADEQLSDATTGMTGTLELHSTQDLDIVQVAGQPVPLEADFSVVLAHGLSTSPLWKFSLRGLFEGQAATTENRLIFTRSPQRGRIPIVFVHGTASNPAYWAEMLNVLLNDPELRSRTQCWFFQYASGNPLLYSAMSLREALQQTIERLDPDGTDPDLKRMVIIGHSQGGLVTKLMTVDGRIEWLEEGLGRPIEDFDFDAKQMALLERVYEFDPLPFVQRVVFICTPHQGSFLAGRWGARMVAKLIAFPGELQDTLGSVFQDTEKLPAQLQGHIPTSLDNMNPGNKLLQILHRTPIAGWTTPHSIVAIGDADEHDPVQLSRADDGVVTYTSAHIEPVASEFLVHSGHSCQDKPATISEVRRILRAHLRSP